MRSVAGTLKVDLAQFRDLEAFATFASDLDAVSKAQLERGYRLVELLKQPLNSPMPVELQVVSVYAGTSGALDDVPANQVRRFESELHEWMQARYSGMLGEIRDTGKLPEGDTLDARGARVPRRLRGRPREPSGNTAACGSRDGRSSRRLRRLRSSNVAGGQERVLRRRIRSIQSTQKITRAQQLIAASRIARRKRRSPPLSPTARASRRWSRTSRSVEAGASPLLVPREEIRRVAYIVVAGDRGLCGAYNTSVIRAAERSILEQQRLGRDYSLVLVGRKAESYFRYRGYRIDAVFTRFLRSSCVRERA